VCALVNRKFTKFNVLDTDPNLELIAFDILFVSFTYRCILCYRPPFYDDDASFYFNLLLNSLTMLCNTKHVLTLFGDFNLPYICWDTLLVTGSHANYHNMFLEFTSQHGLIQCVAEPTRENNILDLILVNDPLIINSCVTAAPLGNSDHNIVEFNLVMPTDKPSNLNNNITDDVKQYCYNFKEADFDGLNSFLTFIDWQSVLCSDNSNNCMESFINILNIGMDEFVPLKPVSNLSCPSHDRKFNRQYPLYIRQLFGKKTSCLAAVQTIQN